MFQSGTGKKQQSQTIAPKFFYTNYNYQIIKSFNFWDFPCCKKKDKNWKNLDKTTLSQFMLFFDAIHEIWKKQLQVFFKFLESQQLAVYKLRPPSPANWSPKILWRIQKEFQVGAKQLQRTANNSLIWTDSYSLFFSIFLNHNKNNKLFMNWDSFTWEIVTKNSMKNSKRVSSWCKAVTAHGKQ